jgi:hypothetical protein
VTKALSIAVSTSTASIWPSNPVPAIVDGGDPQSVELGVKFQSDVAGFIKSVRFYKSAANTGKHVGHLWSSTGQNLGTVTFTGETGSGWQQMNFATPVAIQANPVYVASYFAPKVTTAPTSTTSRPRGSTRRRYMRSRPASPVGTACTPMERRARSRPTRTRHSTTGWTWCSAPAPSDPSEPTCVGRRDPS